MENYKETNIKESFKKTIEQQANYEGNHTLLFIERVSSPLVFERLVDNLYEDISTRDISKMTNFETWTINEKRKIFQEGELGIKAYIKKKLNKSIDDIGSSTPISFSSGGWAESCYSQHQKRENINITKIDSFNFIENKKQKNKIYEVISSHEKGHAIRHFHPDSNFSKRLLSAFNFDNFSLTQESYEAVKRVESWYENPKFSEAERVSMENDFREYNALPHEIIERMSQLKNYFGMSSVEIFTEEHLEYAKNNYISDTGIISIQMKPFLESISDKKKFISFMNNLGI